VSGEDKNTSNVSSGLSGFVIQFVKAGVKDGTLFPSFTRGALELNTNGALVFVFEHADPILRATTEKVYVPAPGSI
jgi:hypothetical protein